MTIPSVAAAVASVGLLPVDESTVVSQTLVDPVLGLLLAAAPNARDQGATDHSAEVLATGVDGSGGFLLSAAPNSPSQGATDFGDLVSMYTVDGAAGTLLGAPSFFPVGHIMPALSVWGLLLLVALLSGPGLALYPARRVAPGDLSAIQSCRRRARSVPGSRPLPSSGAMGSRGQESVEVDRWRAPASAIDPRSPSAPAAAPG